MATTNAARTDKVLVVDDDARIRDLLNRYLTQEGFEVMVAEDGKALNRLMLRETADLIVLDLMMPGEDGLSICRRLRAANDRTPIIMLTAKGEDVDRIVGLEVGADDYLGKPFNPRELLARIRAVLRRTQAGAKAGVGERAAGGTVMHFPGLVVDWKRFTITRDGEETQLSRYEAEILRMLIDHRGEVVSRQDLLRKVWGYVHLPTTRTVDNHIARLRKKLEPAGVSVRTIRGLGYLLEKAAND